MPGPRVLFVKLSSLGDVVHHLPAVSDLLVHRPDATIGWAIEAPYAELVRLHPGVTDAIPVPLRGVRRRAWSVAAWRAFAAGRHSVRATAWDYVIDTQGLLKSACVARWAQAPVFGLDAHSARERLAARLYDVRLRVDRRHHAVHRNRRLVAQVFGYRVEGSPCYGLRRPDAPPSWAPTTAYVVLLHAASHAAKRWPQAHWSALAARFAERGYTVVFPGGTDRERAIASRLAAAVPRAMAAPAMTLGEVAALLAHAAGVVGVDTGLTHLAVALDVPTIGIYCATEPALTGLHGGVRAINLGAPGAPPTLEAVARAAGLASVTP